MKPASRFENVDVSIIRQINALATSLTTNLGLGEPNLEPDETFREMARAAAGAGSWQYTANAGNLGLRTRIAGSLDGTYDPRTEVCVTAGTQEGLFAIAQAYVEAGDEVLTPDPGFLSYDVLVRLAGGMPVHYRLDAETWQPDTHAIASLITERTRAIILNSPSNPTGAVIPEAVLREIVELARSRGLLVISDEVYREIHYGDRPASVAGMGTHVLVVSGLSKSHGMTGLRLGWVAAEQSLMLPILRAHQYIATCASAFSQQLAEAVFTNSRWNASWLASVREQFGQQREAALDAARLHLHSDLAPPAGAFYLFVPVPLCDTLSLAKALATDAAVLVIPGMAFGPGGEGFLRISYAASVEQIQTGIRHIGEYLGSRRIEN
ncbi:MAG TPA: pyridoxal phosphate-dependent aminotransferase [Thermoanaerobaculia bacterium]|nr:pyridoxal phosphate-dependent aminotransferase [Thermoanaerobaculia bacterium]